MAETKYDIGMIGLGTMGRNLVLNMADHGFAVAGYDVDRSKVGLLRNESVGKNVYGADSLKDLVQHLNAPRAVMLMVPAGHIVDKVITDLMQLLRSDDLIIDGGNSHYKDTDRRAEILARKRIRFLGVGVSGGEQGARFGPSIMPGGPRDAYEQIRPIFEAIAAQVNGEPCVTFVGTGSAGHYVKMVHNGIEYALMELIAESYDFMKRGRGLNDVQMYDVFHDWNATELQSFLIEITSRIFLQEDDNTGKRLVDNILDRARQKGTGKWTSQDAMDLQVPIPTIDAAVSMRDMSSQKEERVAASKALPHRATSPAGKDGEFLLKLRNALHCSMIVAYAQGMALLRSASHAYGYGVSLPDVAKIWRGGCIIRSGLLEDIRGAYSRKPELPNLMLDELIAKQLLSRADDLRAIIQASVAGGIPVPGMMASLSYFDSYRSEWLPANLIQAQRDYFGAHTYERVDAPGTFHTEWRESK